jgi:hypothetical protein
VLTSVKATPTALSLRTISAFHTFLSKPVVPPCNAFSPSLTGIWYVVPSSVNRPFAIRLPKRPMVAPKYGLSAA